MRKELAPKYDHLEVEKDKYQNWVKEGYFTAGDKSKDPYCIVIPPPNVTGKLHLGHAWDTTLQDIIARYKRMQGYDMLWLSGMDHAGIATQAKVDARLKEQGTNRYELGREKFLEKAWEWKEEYSAFIRSQWAVLGLSLDYSRERFTLDEGLQKAVKKVFVDLYNEGLIYQGERIINWDPAAKTALSNIEVIHKEIEGAMYYFKYKVVGTNETLTVATTRPETMFGDVCVVVHPDDPRYKHLHSASVINPANGDILPIICDDYIDLEFGTGAMKCTPAHDPNDFLLGEKHHLAKIICMNPDGTMNDKANEFKGLDRFECRKQLVAKIEKEGNLVKIEKHVHQVGHSERTDVVVEPYLSKQWFVKMKPLAEAVIKQQANADEKISFYPERFENTLNGWLENIEDWCISRQLWWGHNIPAYYHKETGEVVVSVEPPKDIENYVQDEDVLDTWFSSALWPFSTLGWPDVDSSDYQRYFPNDVLVTGYDIIFFWVARMAIQSRHFTNSRPFKHCLIHGLVRDALGRKMSKSLGNGVDPMEVVHKHGADALRFFLTTNSTPGLDLRYIDEKVESTWNFINKIWNASRFVLMNIDENASADLDLNSLTIVDKWIIKRLNDTIEHVNMNMEKYEFSLVGNELYNFIWDDFCSWYIELSKAGLNSKDENVVKATKSTLLYVLKNIIKLIHPFMPFVSEEIYSSISDKACCISSWPKVEYQFDFDFTSVDRLIEMIKVVRELRVQYNVKPSLSLDMCVYKEDNSLEVLDENIKAYLKKMANIEVKDSEFNEETISRPIYLGSIALPLKGLINIAEEIKKLEVEASKLDSEILRCEKMLSNENFISKAKPEKIESEKAKLEDYKMRKQLVITKLEEFKNKM